MKYFLLITLTWISLHVAGQEISKPHLPGCWTDSREENSQGSNVFIYRPCDYMVFPKSWFRFRMDLKSDSTCSWLVLAANDGHYMMDGTWTINKATNELMLINKEGKEVLNFAIVEVLDNRLTIKKLNTNSLQPQQNRH
jgi:hypothetical protein